MGISFPSPVDLQMDNSTAEVFVNDTAYKTKLKHIDVRQKWMQNNLKTIDCRPETGAAQLWLSGAPTARCVFDNATPKHDLPGPVTRGWLTVPDPLKSPAFSAKNTSSRVAARPVTRCTSEDGPSTHR